MKVIYSYRHSSFTFNLIFLDIKTTKKISIFPSVVKYGKRSNRFISNKKKLRNEQIHEQKKILVSLSHFNYLLNNILCTRNEMKSINV